VKKSPSVKGTAWHQLLIQGDDIGTIIENMALQPHSHFKKTVIKD